MTLDKTVDAYCAAWGEPSGAARTALLNESWGDVGVYEDPLGVVPPGRSALDAHILKFQQGYPGAKIVRTSRVDEHHSKIQFTWRLILPDGSVAIEGRDFGELDASGRIGHIVGFFDLQPAK